MEKINSKKALRITLSILIAIGIWLYVDIEKAPDVSTWVRDIPVEFSSENTALADKGLMLLSGYDTTIDLKLKAPRKELVKLNSSEVRIVADTSSIHETGLQSLSYQIYYPDSISRSLIRVEDASAYSVTVTVGELHTKTIPIKCEISGEVTKGFKAGDLTLDPQELTLRGQRDDLLNLSYASIEVDISGAEKTVVESAKYKLYDYNGVPVTNENIRADFEMIQAVIPVTTTKEIPLKIQFEEAAGSTLDQVEYSISPSTIQLRGEKAVLDNISEIVLDTIYLQDLKEKQSLSYEIPVPDDTTLISHAKNATVTIIVSGVSEKSMTVDQIVCDKVPDGFEASLETTSLDITLRGLSKELEKLKEQDVRVVADLSGVTEEGLNTVPAEVQISAAEDISAKGSYQVIVSVTKSKETAAAENTENTAQQSGTTE